MGITIYTIAYNGYGIYLKEWLKHVKKNKPDEIIIVLGKDHGADIKELKGCKILYSDSDVMGTLRNIAVKEITTEWMLYFSADDILLPNAVEEIYKTDTDIVALRYIERLNGVETVKQSGIDKDIRKWKNNSLPGYIAVKHKEYYEDVEIPNYPYLFMLLSKGYVLKHTENVCARYERRENSHGDKAYKSNLYKEYTKYIDERAKYYYENRLIRKGYIVVFPYHDTYINRLIERDEYLDVAYKGQVPQERIEKLLKLGYIKREGE